MADFCKQCSVDVWGEDTKDLANLAAAYGVAELKDGEGFSVICEGCGPTLVDNAGACINPSCEKHGL